MILETHRLRLRLYTLDDEAALFEVFADPYARRFYPEMEDRAQVRRWIQWSLHNYERHGFGLWAMESRASGEFLGDCGLTNQEVEGAPELELGYHVLARERGQGYATEAVRACRDYAFTHTDCQRLCSIVDARNPASQKVAGRVHTARREILRRDRPFLLFVTTREEWESRRA